MRKIIFRGKRVNDGKWVYGDIATNPGAPWAEIYHYDDQDINDDHDYVDKKTVGQFTSLYDKDKQEIYEGDILEIEGIEQKLEVRFVRGVFAFLWNGDLDDECPLNTPTHLCVKVIGNIHDNPELMKGGKK